MAYLQRGVPVQQRAERVIPSRAGRGYLLLQNRGPGDVYIGLGEQAAASESDGFHLCKGASQELSDGRPDMAVYAMTPTAARLVVVEG